MLRLAVPAQPFAYGNGSCPPPPPPPLQVGPWPFGTGWFTGVVVRTHETRAGSDGTTAWANEGSADK